jgi:hypothetical protein
VNIDLDYAAASPLILAADSQRLLANCRGPAGLAVTDVANALAETLSQPLSGPPLRQHVVPGDRVVVALPGRLPGGGEMLELVVRGLIDSLTAGGVAPDDIAVLTAPPLDLLGPEEVSGRQTAALPTGLTEQTIRFQPEMDDETAYLLADGNNEPLHLARELVDADVVVAVETFSVDPALGGRSPAGELWPGFGRRDRRLMLTRSLLHARRPVLEAWRTLAADVTDQLGLLASLRLVPGCGNTLAGLTFGFPADCIRLSRRLARSWRPAIEQRAALTIAGINAADCTLATLTRAVAAAAQATRPDGTICVACSLAGLPEGLFTSWRQGASLQTIVGDAAGSDDLAIVTEALQVLLFARSLGDRRLVLCSGLDEETVEALDIGHADGPDAVNRLIRQADSLIVLHEADWLCPRQ